MGSLHGFLPRIAPMNRIGDRNAAFRLQRVEVPMVLQPEGRVPKSRFMGVCKFTAQFCVCFFSNAV